ncbi:MAG: PP2C family protein-serine/threonine phosphatase [Bacteroidales bacterium]
MRLGHTRFDRLTGRLKRNRFIAAYTSGLTSEDLQRLFTRDTVEAYRFFARTIDPAEIATLPWHRRLWAHVRLFFLAFTLKLSPARRAVYGFGVLAELIGLFQLARLGTGSPGSLFPHGTLAVLLGFLLTNLLVLLEVADRLSLKNDLDIAREIQQQMLPRGPYTAEGVSAFGRTRPANTVGGDFYDILRAPDGRLLIAVGDVAGKGSPAALLMALLLAIFRTLVDEGMELGMLVERLNHQVARHAPASRFITFFVAAFDPVSGRVDYVNAGHLPPMVWRRSTREIERWTAGGIALGMFDHSRYATTHATLAPGDRLVLYSDGLTEAENAAGQPFEDQGLEGVVRAYAADTPQAFADTVFRLVEHHTKDSRLTDDLTILVLERLAVAAPVATP